MSAVNRAAVEAVLRQYTDPYLNQDPVSAGCVRAIEVQGDQVSVQLELGYAAGLFKSGEVALVLDVDSDKLNDFDEVDERCLGQAIGIIEKFI